MTTKLLTVLGSTNIDMICQLDHLPAVGETVTGGKFMQALGGKGANQAVAAARAGGDVAFITCLGDDAYAAQCIEAWRHEGIDTASIIHRKQTSTGVALIMFDQRGRNYLGIASGANHAITSVDIELYADVIRESSMLVMQNEIAPEPIARALEIAHSAHIPVLFNYAPVMNAPVPVTNRMGCLVVNETEASQLTKQPVSTGHEVRAAAKMLADMGPAVVIITLGANGSFVRHNGHELHIPPYRVNAVDTTAAGDTYCGALAVALLEGASWPDAVKFASAASAISVTRPGAQPSIPKRAEIDAFLIEHG